MNEYRHVAGITSLYPEPDGIRLCFFDERLDAYIYSPVDDALTKISAINSTAHVSFQVRYAGKNVKKSKMSRFEHFHKPFIQRFINFKRMCGMTSRSGKEKRSENAKKK